MKVNVPPLTVVVLGIDDEDAFGQANVYLAAPDLTSGLQSIGAVPLYEWIAAGRPLRFELVAST